MSPTSSETDTHDIALVTPERWVVHHVLAARIDEAIDADERPPEWALEAFAAIESDGETETLTDEQIRHIARLLESYLDDAPKRDVVYGSAVLERLESRV